MHVLAFNKRDESLLDIGVVIIGYLYEIFGFTRISGEAASAEIHDFRFH